MEEMHSEKFVEYCIGMAKEFDARLNRIRVFVAHNLTSGNANELILRDFLAMHAPKRFHVGEGFICDPTAQNKVSRQCDILVYDQGAFPVVYEDGPIKIVWPDSARVVIEVKTTFEGEAIIESAIDNIQAARAVSKQVNGIIFAFRSATIKTIQPKVHRLLSSVSSNERPSVILLFDRGIIIHRTANHNRFIVHQAKNDSEKQAVVIAYLLLIFFDSVWNAPQGTHDAGTVQVLRELLDRYTTHIDSILLDSPI